MRSVPNLAFVLVMTSLPPLAGRAVAQLPGDPLTSARMSIRGEYIAHTYKEVQRVLADWAERLEDRDVGQLDDLLAKEVLFSPLEGWQAKGEKPVTAALAAYLPRLSGYGLSVVDFDASSSLAYVLGSVYYQLGEAGSRKLVTGQVAIILSRQGTRWKIRSYLERPANPEP